MALKNASQFLVTVAAVAAEPVPEPGDAAGEVGAGEVGAIDVGVVAGDELVLGPLLPQAAADAASAASATAPSECEIRR